MNALLAEYLMPFLPSGEDYDGARRFFLELGFEEMWESDGYAGFRNGGARFILQRFHDPAVSGHYMMQLHVPDLETWWEALPDEAMKERHAFFKAKPPADYPWGREVHLIGPGGVAWRIQQAASE